MKNQSLICFENIFYLKIKIKKSIDKESKKSIKIIQFIKQVTKM